MIAVSNDLKHLKKNSFFAYSDIGLSESWIAAIIDDSVRPASLGSIGKLVGHVVSVYTT